MAIGRLGTEIGDPQRRFKRPAARNDFTKYRTDGVSGKWAASRRGDTLQNLLLAVGNVNLLTGKALAVPDTLCQRGPSV